jgi:hypothetical protein
VIVSVIASVIVSGPRQLRRAHGTSQCGSRRCSFGDLVRRSAGTQRESADPAIRRLEDKMSNRVAVFCLLFAGCAAGATGGAAVDRETAPRIAARSEAARAFPVAKDPQLPTADRMFRQIRNELGDVASADVRLCVASDGRVEDVAIVRGTRFPAFNEALVHDMSHWQFSESRGSDGAARRRNCEVRTISYLPHP